LLVGEIFWQPTFGVLSELTFLATPLTALATIVAAYRARWKIRQSNGALAGMKLAGSSLTTGYATILLGVLFVVTVCANVKYHPCSSACINNLRQLDGAKEQWALENQKTATDTPTMVDLVGTDKYIKVTPQCPGNGTYTLGNMSTKPTCSVSAHTLPWSDMTAAVGNGLVERPHFPTQYNFAPVRMNKFPWETAMVERMVWSPASPPMGILANSVNSSAAFTTDTSPLWFIR